MTRPVSRAAVERWLATRGWKPFAFQREVWHAMAEGRSGLLHANTGTGKTLAAWLGALQALRVEAPPARVRAKPVAPPLSVLWITPMRALAADTTRALRDPMTDLAPTWTIGLRSGDTTSAERSAQDRRLPTVLVTTPESLTLQLARADALDTLAHVQLVVVDEWHELLGNKRGVQVQLALARLRQRRPDLICWALSATLGNLEEALATLVGVRAPARDASAPEPALVRGEVAKTIVIDTLLPERAERFSWGGHMGLRMLPQVVQAIEEGGTTLVFTNTRSQAERWYQALLEARPDWAGVIALHHGSLAKEVRDWVEQGLKAGTLRAVVCTSSLDLGVDFLPVDRVLQIGSAKGIARLLQRAGRSGHAPGRPSRVTLVPTHSLELVEAAAARHAAQAGQVERRHSPHEPLDVLVQHLVTIALGGGFVPDALYEEVRTTTAYRDLDASNWQWCLDFVRQGGPTLASYPDFQRVAPDELGVWRVPDARLARRHRVNIGTIVSDASINVQYQTGGPLGSVEESFVARMKPGDCFLFGGRMLELIRIHQMTAYVKKAPPGRGAVPRWNGGRMPLSNTLADAVLRELDAADHDVFDSPEMQCVRPLLDIQRRWSALPTPTALVAETWKDREGWHLFLYPFAGRQVHLGLASLLAWRAAQPEQATFSIAINDYGLELLSAREIAWAERLPALLVVPDEPNALLSEVLASLNATELSRRRFREIARIAGLIFQSHPGERQSNRQLQASAGLYFDVFQKYDPGNRLLAQAESELLSQELDVAQLAAALRRMSGQRLVAITLARPSPLAFPLMVERFREKLSNESLSDRIARMVADLEGRAGGDAVGTAHEDAKTVFARPAMAETATEAIQLDRVDPPRRAPRSRRRPRA
ncbi:ligase-associated DNA damage response DEXH box helicase [Scleromatobacter humisilvae]|uniref:Ligase-associated DNA damage response DEXH box helicase n=1 Tax=Scleromatobacter humisilvae TaxID=2897159 RepID=A0A9X1YQY1_9BURK|nr:ligase-associated DNA damage response DEXH box helicase [Scleromatobacter humisilvae]MCK9689677.1 ligase-associated DNA damage response DEXH box helicase [Scleromatobacter humisilvae]